jgi:hypothetical protein
MSTPPLFRLTQCVKLMITGTCKGRCKTYPYKTLGFLANNPVYPAPRQLRPGVKGQVRHASCRPSQFRPGRIRPGAASRVEAGGGQGRMSGTDVRRLLWQLFSEYIFSEHVERTCERKP